MAEKRRRRRVLWAVPAALVLLVVWALVSPRPSALLVRVVFDRGGASVTERMQEHVPAGVTGVRNLSYGERDDELLDIWYPRAHQGSLPVIVWIHGGAWVSGSKDQVAPYLKILAGRGYAVVGVDYSLAPGSQYPTPLDQVSRALAWLELEADQFPLDSTRVVLAGDSAGAQIAAQLAAMATDREYAAAVGVDLRFDTRSIRGTILNCGAYQPELFGRGGGLLGWFSREVVRAYFGGRDADHPAVRQASVVSHVTESFPPTWISGGNDDPLTSQGEAMAKRLEELGVPVTTLFYPADHTPALPHEYQFDLDGADGRAALESTVEFLDALFSD